MPGRAIPDWQKRAAEEAYKDVKSLIYLVVWKVVEKYGGDFDDLFSVASIGFVEAYITYDRSRGATFASWVYRSVYWSLIDHIRAESKEKAIPSCDLDHFTQKPSATSKFASLLDSFSEDARAVANLVANTPAEVMRVVNNRGGAPRNYRSAIRDFLRARGWTNERVNGAYREIEARFGR